MAQVWACDHGIGSQSCGQRTVDGCVADAYGTQESRGGNSRYCVRALILHIRVHACSLDYFLLLLDHGLGHVRQEVMCGSKLHVSYWELDACTCSSRKKRKRYVQNRHGKKRQRSPILVWTLCRVLFWPPHNRKRIYEIASEAIGCP